MDLCLPCCRKENSACDPVENAIGSSCPNTHASSQSVITNKNITYATILNNPQLPLVLAIVYVISSLQIDNRFPDLPLSDRNTNEKV